MSTISLSKSLRTTKTTPGLGNVAADMRIQGYGNPVCSYGQPLVDTYGRYATVYAGLTMDGPGIAGCASPLNRIEVENVLRPQYSDYLNVPQGLMEFQPVSEGANRPRADLLGVNRDQAFGLTGLYDYLPAPTPNQLNPNDDANWQRSQAYESMKLDKLFENRRFTNSADIMKSGMY